MTIYETDSIYCENLTSTLFQGGIDTHNVILTAVYFVPNSQLTLTFDRDQN